jgi:surface protein
MSSIYKFMLFLLFAGIVSFSFQENTISENKLEIVNENYKINDPISLKQLKRKIYKEFDVTKVCTSEIEDMSGLFRNANHFNQDISGWDVSNVTDMSYMFAFTVRFSQDLSNWDVSNVENMSHMFYMSYMRGQNISTWNTSKVEDMERLLALTNYKGSLNFWDISSVENKERMLYGKEDLIDVSEWSLTEKDKEELYN